MKKYLLTFLLLAPFLSKAQGTVDSSIDLDVLRAPSSPAFNLLGISPSLIDRPTDLNALRLSLQNASNNFSKFPTDYAVEIAPANLARIPNQTLDKFNSTKFGNVFWQSFSISVGITQGTAADNESTDSGAYPKVAVGIKFSLIRPSWTKKTADLYGKLHNAMAQALVNIQSLTAQDSEFNYLTYTAGHVIEDKYRNRPQDSAQKRKEREAVTARLRVITDSLSAVHAHDSTDFIAIKNAVNNFRIDRKGFFLDFAGGIALDFPDSRFNYSTTSKAGAWLTGGYSNSEGNGSLLGIVRYLYQPDKIYADTTGTLSTANISTLDMGLRAIYTGLEGKFSFSGEGIYRSVLNKNTIDPSWRFTINADYDIGNNKKLTLSIGKNFDGTVTKSGNLIAALNFIAGFGSTKSISSK